ncbi:MAG TPA: hypothetical protein VF611_09660 [Pyrinomonadaceae bacterium]|jgi:hypothetical protein
MAGRKGNAKSSCAVLGRSNGRNAKTSVASALTQVTIERSQRSETSRSSRAQPSADELALRAWETTYKNNKSKVA